MDIAKGFDSIKQENIDYFLPFTYEKPIIVTDRTNQELKSLGTILYKAIAYLLENYEDFLDYLPRDERELQIFEICRRHPHPIGTFRTDFVIDKNDQIKIIEMTTRQPLNGYFASGFFREFALKQAERWQIDNIEDRYPAFFKYLEDCIGEAKHICVLSGNSKKYEIKLYPRIFETAGLECHIIPLENLDQMAHLLENAWIIEELTLDEIKSIPIELIEDLAPLPILNNFFTLFHTHDKRLFNLLAQKSFLEKSLDYSEQDLLRKYLTPTFIFGRDEAEWSEAFVNKDKYILKHKHLGKSVDIYAGAVTEENEWKALFETGAVKNFVLQQFIDQKLFDGIVGKEIRKDFVAGTLLYFNDEYFGPGLYRASSFPVTNVKDDRKIPQLVINSNEMKEGFHYL